MTLERFLAQRAGSWSDLQSLVDRAGSRADRLDPGELYEAATSGASRRNRKHGVSTLHHHFRGLTAMSPLQYQKQLRLQAARGHMLLDGLDAASAGFEVGYESVSQFNREYSRLFGQPPMRDIRTLHSPGAPALESVSNR